ncbi:hypothetical protein BOTBODRAFT_158904 [Botryobasidium botryosum FD-172 SS1]|uniref:Cullin family profile domain-containing protein n=1 Tax=Botryobasidium botryosum (strain FD-172 SS1) TaxID=930990 RepID=A0A067MJJ6_BOTB1|nr:hypothetical protein BOTBODRAFT_158904 [Botryobasidium botryosum FD-172 SS1]
MSAIKLRKPKIKPPRKLGADTAIEETWKLFSEAVREIFNHRASNLSYEENYRYAYNLVLYKNGHVLYDGLRGLITENLDKLAKKDIVPAFPATGNADPVQQSQEGERLLNALRDVWEDHSQGMSRIRDLVKYMDKNYTVTAKVLPIWDAGVQLFLQRIIRSPAYNICSHIINCILTQIHIERDGYTITRSSMKGCVDILLQIVDIDNGLSVYKTDLEPRVLQESKAFFEAECERLLEVCDAPEYLRRAEAHLASEAARTQNYLSYDTHAPLQRIVEDYLLRAQFHTIMAMPSSGIDNMIDTDKIEDLARLYRLFKIVPTEMPVLKKALKNSIAARGKTVNDASGEGEGGGEDEEEPQEVQGKGKGKERARPAKAGREQSAAVASKWVQDVLDLQDLFDRVLKLAFGNEVELQTAINEAFESFINLNPKAPEFISIFMDENLKKGLKGKSDEEVEVLLDKTIGVFRFITEKDVFERYYKTHLAKRLLNGRSISDDAERGMLAKLKVECGFQFTQKLEGMFHDMKLSAETMAAYKESVTRPSIDISVQVLTSTFWPMTHGVTPCTFSAEMNQAITSFERYYLSRHSGRRLTWQAAMGSADVRATFKARKHDLNVSTYALVVLLLFENVDEGGFLTYDEIKLATSIEDVELRRTLQSLACAKFKVLKKHPPSREVAQTDSFSFNNDFTAPLQRIKIGTVASRAENDDQRKETMERVDEERKHQTDACIVRVMKDRKRMTHNDLINEATAQLAKRFQPNPAQIKKRIEALIEREYLDRGEDKKSYIYLA